MKRAWIKPAFGISVLIATIAIFIAYYSRHQEVGQQLRHTSPELFATIFGLYLISTVSLVMVTIATVRLCKTELKGFESVRITAYTALVNFFGPLQSGPAFRAIYLKKKHKISFKDYGLASLVYYFFFGSLNVALLLSVILEWWLLPLTILVIAIGYLITKKSHLSMQFKKLNLPAWYLLALATSLQVIVMTAIYYTELHSVAPGTSLSQVLAYTGAANLALFVSLTPGAIGFRESFLVLSQNLHHISNSSIVAANILDRAIYLVLLLFLALYLLTTHSRRQLELTNL